MTFPEVSSLSLTGRPSDKSSATRFLASLYLGEHTAAFEIVSGGWPKKQ